MPDPIETLVFGSAAKRHPLTGRYLELGSGALSERQQAEWVHCAAIDREEGREAGDAMRRRLAIYYGAAP